MTTTSLISKIDPIYSVKPGVYMNSRTVYPITGPGLHYVADNQLLAETLAAMLNNAYMLGCADHIIINNQPQE